MKNPFAGGTNRIEAYTPNSGPKMTFSLAPGQVDGVDDVTKQLLSEQVQKATRSDDDYMNDLMAGVSGPKGLLPDQPQAPEISGGDGTSDIVKEAFARRSQREGGEAFGRLSRASGLEIEGRRASDLQRANANQLQKNSLRLQNQDARMQYERQLQEIQFLEEQARASILSDILGLVGSVVGTAFGGGFGVAAAAGGAAMKKAAPSAVDTSAISSTGYSAIQGANAGMGVGMSKTGTGGGL